MRPAAVDVLMTVYNGAAHLACAIHSVRAQTLTDLHLHVVDDGSTDDTPALLAALAREDARITVHRREHAGVVAAANHGLNACRAEFVARMDADDVAHPDRLRLQVDRLRREPDLLAIGGAARHIDPQGRPLGSRTDLPPPELSDPARLPAAEPYLLHPFTTFRRAALLRVGGYRELPVAEDSDLFWRLQEVGRLGGAGTLVGDYRMNPAGLSSRSIAAGRRLAVFSQLAALSAARRRSGRTDLVFGAGYAATITGACGSLVEACEAAAVQIEAAERPWFDAAVAAKLLAMAGHRPYEVETSDCLFARRALDRAAAGLAHADRRPLARSVKGTAARLAAKSRWSDARALAGPRLGPGFWSRYVLRTAVSEATHRRARLLVRAVGRSRP